MFTVLHKTDDGKETLYTTCGVQFIEFSEENGNSSGLHMLAGPGEAAAGVSVGHLKGGRAFIMNDSGATIATYSLFPRPSPPKAILQDGRPWTPPVESGVTKWMA